jgi:hypothetical protein
MLPFREEGQYGVLDILVVNLVMGFLIGYCFRAANEPRRQKSKTSA